MRRALACLVVWMSMACSPAMSSLQPAAALKKGQVHTAAGVGGPIAAGAALRAAQDAGVISKRLDAAPAPAPQPVGQLRDAEDAQGAFASALGAFLFSDTPIAETAVRVGVGHNLDAGLRLASDSVALEGKWQFLGTPERGGLDGSIGLGVGFHLFNADLFANSGNAELASFLPADIKRFDISVPVTFGRQPSEFFQYWYGPKYVFSDIEISSSLIEKGPEIETEEAKVHYLGGTAGFAAGYKRVWFMMELSALNLFFKKEIAGRQEDLGGLIVYPAIGFMTRF